MKTTLITIGLLFAALEHGGLAQRHIETNNGTTLLVSCSIRVDRNEWTPRQPATVYVTVESVSENAFEIPLWSGLSLEPTSWDSILGKERFSTRIMAALEPSVLDPLDRVGIVINRREKTDSAILRFAHKGEKAKFEFDARDLIWGYEVMSSPPTSTLFVMAKPGSYKLQFQMSSGPCESAKLPLTIAAEKPTK